MLPTPVSLAGHTVIFGGSFNPPHLAHQMACLYLVEGLGAQAVWLLPAFVHPFGKELVPFEHRLAMCQLIADPLGKRVAVSDVERREAASGYTYDTLVELTRRHPERRWALAIGTDVLAETPSWHRWPDIEALATIVVMGRQGVAAHRQGVLALPDIASRVVRERVQRRESIEGLVSVRVRAYIEQHGLYL